MIKSEGRCRWKRKVDEFDAQKRKRDSWSMKVNIEEDIL